MPARPYLVWKGQGVGAQGIYSARLDGSTGFAVQRIRYFATSRGLAAVVVPGEHDVLVAWRGAGDDNKLWLARANFDGSGWSDQHNPADVPRTEDHPALGVLNGKVVMAWRGAGPDEHIWYSELGPGGWAPQRPAADGIASSTHGPALAEHRGSLFMVWKGSGNNQNLYWSRYDGSSWTYPQAFAGGSTHGPALVSGPGGLVMAWKGSGNDDHLWRAGYSDRWSPQQLAIGRSSHGPALGRVDNQAVMLWKGTGVDERLWWTRTDFRTEEPVRAGLTTSDTPALIALQFSDL